MIFLPESCNCLARLPLSKAFCSCPIAVIPIALPFKVGMKDLLLLHPPPVPSPIPSGEGFL